MRQCTTVYMGTQYPRERESSGQRSTPFLRNRLHPTCCTMVDLSPVLLITSSIVYARSEMARTEAVETLRDKTDRLRVCAKDIRGIWKQGADSALQFKPRKEDGSL